jgi:hypothetical protein
MNLDPHWIKDRFKDDSDQQLKFDLMFALNQEVAKEIQTELKRREDESK